MTARWQVVWAQCQVTGDGQRWWPATVLASCEETVRQAPTCMLCSIELPSVQGSEPGAGSAADGHPRANVLLLPVVAAEGEIALGTRERSLPPSMRPRISLAILLALE